MRLMKVAAVLLLGASCAANVLLFERYRALQGQQPYLPGEQGLIDRSMHLYVQEANAEAGARLDREAVLGRRFPVVTYTDTERCVNIMLPRTYVGSIPFYCYDNRGRLTRRGRI